MIDIAAQHKVLTQSHIARFISVVAALAIVVGASVMVGWWFHIPFLTSISPDFVTMKPNTAVGFIVSGMAFFFLRDPRLLFLSRAGACVLALGGLLTLAQYCFGFDLGIDQSFFPVPPSDLEPQTYGRMALMTSVCFFLLGAALLCASFERTVWLSQWLVLPVGLMGLLVLTAYLYGALDLIIMGYAHTLMAIHSAILFCLISIAAFLLQPQQGLARLVTGDTLGGWIFRRLFPVVAAIPLLVGWLQILGEDSGHFNSAFRIAFVMVLMIPLAGVLLWYTARGLDRLNAARRRAEQVLREHEESYYNQFADNSVVMMMIDPDDGAIIDANTSAQKFYGYTADQLKAMHITDINMMPQDVVRQAWETVQQGKGGKFEFTHRLADGSLRSVAVSTSRVRFGDRFVLHSIINDITDLKKAEKARHESEEQYRLLTENAYAAIASHEMIFDAKGRAVDYVFLNANPAFEKQTGLRVDDIIGRHVRDVLPGIEDSLFLPIYGQVVRTGEPISFEHYSEPLQKHYAVTAYSLGENRFATQFTDITERKKAEEALRKREAFLDQLLETIPMPVFSTDREGRYVLANKAFATFLWKSKAEILGKNIFDLFPPELAKDEHEDYANLLAEPGASANYSKIQDGLGVTHDVIFRKATLTDEEGEPTGLIGAILDITDFKRVEEELDKATRLLEKASKKTTNKGP